MESDQTEDGQVTFGQEMRQRMLKDFTVGYYNGSVKPNLAEKDPATGRDVEFLMDSRQFERTDRAGVWSFSEAVGTGYQYKVVYKDKRFSGLDQLLGIYSGSVAVADEDRPMAEQRLYEMVMQLMKEGRLPRNFKVQPVSDPRVEKLSSSIAQLTRALADLDARVKTLEQARQVAEEGPLAP